MEERIQSMILKVTEKEMLKITFKISSPNATIVKLCDLLDNL